MINNEYLRYWALARNCMLVTMILQGTENNEIPPSALYLRQGLNLQTSISPGEDTEQF